MNNKNSVSIIIPVIRSQNIKNLVRLIKENAGIPENEYEILVEEDKERIGAPKMVKKLTKKAKYNLVMFLGDDCLPQSDFLKNALVAMATLTDQWGLVGLNDLQRPSEHAPTHWLAHKKLLRFCKEFFYTGYIHQYCDNELYMWAKMLKRYIYANNAKIFHDHIGFKNKNKNFYTNINESNDNDMKRVYAAEAHDHDLLLFKRRQSYIVKNTSKLAVVGIRSGTSAVAKILDMAGVSAGDSSNLLNGNRKYSEKAMYGYYENFDVLRINEAILFIYGGSWHKPPIFPNKWWNSPDKRMKRLREEAYKIKPMLIKDPRLCLTWKFWSNLYNMMPVLCTRSPEAIDRSLLRSQGITHGLQLWLAYLKSFHYSLDTSEELTEVQFDKLFNKNNIINRVKQIFKVYKLEHLYKPESENAVKQFINSKMKHY